MSLPPGFLDELRARVSLARLAGRKVTWDRRKSNPAKGDWWAPCPFHQEKTASFHLDDNKGFYYCFGCHAKGDAITFLRETENLDFMEAVAQLAREAGMEMPARDPAARQKADRRAELAKVMERAVRFYRMQLNGAAGAAARDYLDGRGLDGALRERFEIGFAPDDRTALFRHLTGAGIDPALIVEAGLAIAPEDGGAPFDRFRGRVMFPIRDARARCIAFGGRALNPEARAKYLNSPETPLFDKGRSLFNIGPARAAAAAAGTVIVAEGYLDVIALVAAGFEHAVAPLGTAITEDQLRLLWRLAPEPVIALDGDRAGQRAAMRLIDLALPHLEPGRTLRFCLMPEGLDPDDLLRRDGPAAMQALLDGARPLVDLLWQRETEGRPLDTPERRAALDVALKQAIGRIRDRAVRAHYAAEIRDRRRALFRAERPSGRTRRAVPRSARRAGGMPFPPPGPSAETRNSPLARGAGETGESLREAMVVALCLNYPALVPEFETALERLQFRDPALAALCDALLAAAPDAEEDAAKLRAAVEAAVGADGVEKLLARPHLRIAPLIRHRGRLEDARLALAEQIALLSAEHGARAEIEDAMRDMDAEADEGLTWRLEQAARARDQAARSAVAAAGSRSEDREEMSRYLQQLIENQAWKRKRRR